jgi:tetratricopeptide (TPR) repeat protein
MNSQLSRLAAGNQARSDGQYERARELYINYLRDYGNDADIMWTLAEVTFEVAFRNTDNMSRFLEEAVKWITSAIELDADRAEFFVTLGKILAVGVEAPEYQKAANCYRKALELNPNLFSAAADLSFLARIPDSSVTVAEAIAIMERLARVKPDNPEVFAYLGRLYNKAGRPTEAQLMVKRALLCPEPLEAPYVKELVFPRDVDLDVNV